MAFVFLWFKSFESPHNFVRYLLKFRMSSTQNYSVLGIHQDFKQDRVNKEMTEYYSLFEGNKTGATKG